MQILIKNILAILPEETKITDIYIKDNEIISTDKAPENFTADEIINGAGKLASAGFINAHTHNYMTLFRNYADDLTFEDWLFGHIMPMEDKLTPEDAYFSAMLGAMEMIKSGATSYMDMHMFPEVTVKSAHDSGMRAVISRGLSGGENDVEGGKRRIREARAEIEKFKNFSDRISFMIAPHAVYTCDEGFMRETAELAKELGLGINSHISETDGEVSSCVEKYGVSPVEFYEKCGLLNEKTVAAHCVQLSDKDIEILAKNRVTAVINTGSNLKLANGLPRVDQMKKAGINMCFGTDSAASNNSLSILREMQLFSLVHKGVTRNPTIAPAVDCYDMATKNGAIALGMKDKLGELKAGQKADIAIFDITDEGRVPLLNAKSAMCYSSAGWNAETVIIDGNIVLKNGEFTAIDAEKIKFEVKNSCKKLGMEK